MLDGGRKVDSFVLRGFAEAVEVVKWQRDVQSPVFKGQKTSQSTEEGEKEERKEGGRAA